VLHLLHMTAKETTLKEVGEMLTYIVEHMATKEDIVRLDGRIDKLDRRIGDLSERITSIEAELRLIRRDLDGLMEKFENVSGFRKEIDHALERIGAIEKHLGLNKKIAA
jgi:predicted RNase H-like nuclease (RuvC/YqgF family)